MAEFTMDIFSQYDKKWGLVCAGTMEDHNAMTISWGGMGTLWRRPVVTVYIRHSRHTFGYLENSDHFTLSFFPEELKKIHAVMGSLSGRDIDKDKEAGVTPRDLGCAVGYEEAEITFVCRKIYFQDMDAANIAGDIMEEIYPGNDRPHRMFVGEVVDVIRK